MLFVCETEIDDEDEWQRKRGVRLKIKCNHLFIFITNLTCEVHLLRQLSPIRGTLTIARIEVLDSSEK
jgi:hypothetical protein